MDPKKSTENKKKEKEREKKWRKTEIKKSIKSLTDGKTVKRDKILVKMWKNMVDNK